MTEFYKTYFERLSRKHQIIAHTDQDKSFFYVKDKYNPKAFDDAIKSAGHTPALLLERYTYQLTDNTNKNCLQKINGRFTTVVNTISGDQGSIEQAEGLAEQIALSFIRRMNRDFGSAGGMITLDSGAQQRVIFSMASVPVDPVGPILQRYFGVTVGFQWLCPFPGADQPGDWLDND